jgi:voltage-gated potassium channel
MIATALPRNSDALSRRRRTQLSTAFDWVMTALALAVVPAVLLEEHAATPGWRQIGVLLNWTIWIAFCGDYLARLVAADDRRAYVAHAWIDLAIILVSPPFLVPRGWQDVRTLRALRLLRLFRATAVLTAALRVAHQTLRHRRFHYVALVGVTTIALGAAGMYLLEHDINPNVKTIGDAVWWAIVTATTVGYGDVSPVTADGRVIAVVLMLVGIGMIGVFTATVASYFLESDSRRELAVIDDRLARLEAKIDRLVSAADRSDHAG